jgi:hypothetical protein
MIMQLQRPMPWAPNKLSAEDISHVKEAESIADDLDNTPCPCGSGKKFAICCSEVKTQSDFSYRKHLDDLNHRTENDEI